MNFIVSQESKTETQHPLATTHCSLFCRLRFILLEWQSKTSAEGLGLRCQGAVQTSVGSQLKNGMKSNINTKNRWSTAFSIVLVCLCQGRVILRKMQMTSIPLLLLLNLLSWFLTSFKLQCTFSWSCSGQSAILNVTVCQDTVYRPC